MSSDRAGIHSEKIARLKAEADALRHRDAEDKAAVADGGIMRRRRPQLPQYRNRQAGR
jgi:hypothetical protein